MRTRRTFEVFENILLAISAAVILLSLVMLGATSMSALAAEPTGINRKVVVIGTGVDSRWFNIDTANEACFSTNSTLYASLCPSGASEEIGPGAGEPYNFLNDGLHDSRVVNDIVALAPDTTFIPVMVYRQRKTTGAVQVIVPDILKAVEYALGLIQAGDTSIAAVVLAQGGQFLIKTDPIADCDGTFPGLRTLIADLETHGVPFVSSAGNIYSETGIVAPAICEGAVSVGATVEGPPVAIWEDASHGPQMTLFANGETTYGSFGDFVGSSYAAPKVAARFVQQKNNSPNRTVYENIVAQLRWGTPITTSYGTKSNSDVGPDTDGDGIPALFDNCLDVYNPDQVDPDGDGYGVRCDPDVNNDTGVNFTDAGFCRQFSHDPNLTEFTMYDPYGNPLWTVQRVDCDLNQDGVIDNGDSAVMVPYFYGPPGPSGLVPDPVY